MLKNSLKLRLHTQLIIVMLSMLILFAVSFVFLQQGAEEKVLDLIQDEINSMMKAIEISIGQLQTPGSTPEARLQNFIDQLQTRGVAEVSILGNMKSCFQNLVVNAVESMPKGGTENAGRNHPR